MEQKSNVVTLTTNPKRSSVDALAEQLFEARKAESAQRARVVDLENKLFLTTGAQSAVTERFVLSVNTATDFIADPRAADDLLLNGDIGTDLHCRLFSYRLDVDPAVYRHIELNDPDLLPALSKAIRKTETITLGVAPIGGAS